MAKPNIAGFGEDPAATANKLRAAAQDPDISDEERADYIAALAAIGAIGGVTKQVESTGERAREVVTRPRGVLKTVGMMGAAPLGELGNIAMTAPFEVLAAGAKGAASAIPGPAPAPFVVPPLVQPTQPPPPAPTQLARPGQLQVPVQSAGFGVSAGLRGPVGPGIGSYTGGVAVARRKLGELAEGLGRSRQEFVGGMGEAAERQKESVRAVGEAQARGIEQQTDVVRQASDRLAEQVEEQQSLRQQYIERRDSGIKELEARRAGAKYIRMSQDEAASVVSKREDLRDVISHYHGLDVPLTKEEGEDLRRAQSELDSVNKRLDKASKMRGEWDFEDPSEIFAAIAMSIGSAMGAYASAMTGAPNYALQIAKQRADRIFRRQKAEIGRRKSAVGEAYNDLDFARQTFGDDKIALNEIHMKELDNFRTVAQRLALETQSEQKRAEIGGAIAQIDEQYAKIKMAQDASVADYAAKVTTSAGSLAAQEAKLRQGRDIATQQAMAVRQQAAAKFSERQIPGLRIKKGISPSEQSFGKAQDFKYKYDNTVSGLRKMIEKRGDFWTYMPEFFSEGRAEATAIRADLINVMKDMEGMGANFTNMEKALLEMKVGSSPAQLSRLTAKLRKTMQVEHEKAMNRLKVYGYEFDTPGGEVSFVERPPI